MSPYLCVLLFILFPGSQNISNDYYCWRFIHTYPTFTPIYICLKLPSTIKIEVGVSRIEDNTYSRTSVIRISRNRRFFHIVGILKEGSSNIWNNQQRSKWNANHQGFISCGDFSNRFAQYWGYFYFQDFNHLIGEFAQFKQSCTIIK